MLNDRPRVLVADDHPIVTYGVRKLLEDRYDVVGCVENGRVLLEAAQELKPDVIIAAISMPLLNGFEAVRRLKRTLPETRFSSSPCMQVRTMPSKRSQSEPMGI